MNEIKSMKFTERKGYKFLNSSNFKEPSNKKKMSTQKQDANKYPNVRSRELKPFWQCPCHETGNN